MDRFVWKGELEFAGTVEEYNRLSGLLEKGNVAISGADWWLKHRWPGLWPMPIWEIIGMDRINALIKNPVEVQIEYIKGIRGGIRDPHLHLGDGVALVSRDEFRAVLGEVAATLAMRRLDAGLDYQDAIAPIANMLVTG